MGRRVLCADGGVLELRVFRPSSASLPLSPPEGEFACAPTFSPHRPTAKKHAQKKAPQRPGGIWVSRSRVTRVSASKRYAREGEGTHGAADDVVLVRMPADVPDARVVAGQLGDHSARQHVVNCKDHWKPSKFKRSTVLTVRHHLCLRRVAVTRGPINAR